LAEEGRWHFGDDDSAFGSGFFIKGTKKITMKRFVIIIGAAIVVVLVIIIIVWFFFGFKFVLVVVIVVMFYYFGMIGVFWFVMVFFLFVKVSLLFPSCLAIALVE
jgi:hypothetical protein